MYVACLSKDTRARSYRMVFAGQRATPPPARREAAPRRRNCGDEGVSECVRTDELGDARALCHSANDPARTVAVEAVAVDPEEDRALTALADCEVDGTGRAWRERDGDNLAALAHDGEGSMSAFEAQRFDVGTSRL